MLQKQAGEKPASASYRRDALGRTLEETITYGEGAAAIRRTLRHSFTPDGPTFSYDYHQGHLQRARLPEVGELRWSQYHWQQPTRIELPGAVRTLDYDPLQRLTHIQVQAIGPGTAETPSGPIQLDWRLAYDLAGNLLQRDTRDGPTSYAYDPLDRLIEVVPPASVPELPLEGYQYDGVGNRTQSLHQPGAWGYDPDHRLTQYGEGATLTALTHSPNGQRSERITPNHRTRYHYDAADRLTSLERDGQEQARYQYDPFGRRISKTVAGITTWYLYTDEGLIAELDETGKTTRAYGWEPDSAYGTKPLWQAEIQGASWQFHFLHPDHLGTPQLATDAQGNISWQAQSEAFGRTFPAPSNAITMNLRFPGQYFDQESGFHYNYSRDYDPEVGRYIERDPMGLEGGVNIYAYVENNPLRFKDPLGLWVKRCARGLGNKDKPPKKPSGNPFRHDYLSVSGQVLSFQAGGSMIWGQGYIDTDEYPDNPKCIMICEDDKFDQYVLDAAREIGEPKYCIAANPGFFDARNCQSWSNDVLRIAKQKYLENEQCPKCFQ